MKPLILRHVKAACHEAGRAFFWTDSHENGVARNFARTAAIKLIRSLGVDEAEIDKIRDILQAHESQLESDYANAKARREVIDERRKLTNGENDVRAEERP